MLKLFVAAAELALPLCLLSAALIANRSYAPRLRQRVGRLTVGLLASGTLVALVVAWLRLETRHVRLPVVNLWTGAAMLVALAAFVAALWLMGRRRLVADAHGWRPRLLTATALAALLLVAFFYGLPLYLAVDKVVPMGGTLFASDSLVNLIGYLLGVATALFAGIAVGISLGRVPSLVRRGLTTLLLGIALITQWAPLYQQLATLKIVPRSSGNFQALLWIQHHAAAILLAYAAVVVVTSAVAVLVRRRQAPEGASRAEQRLVKADGLSRRRMLGWSTALGASLAVTYTFGKQIAEAVPELSPIEPSVVNGDHVEVSLELVGDGHLHRFAYASRGGTEVRFIVIQKNANAYGTGLDACEICGPSGYFERDGKVVCRECDVIMNTQTIGFPGGCNPIPIQHEITAGKLLFQVAELEQQARVFR
ncbi:MAG: DUF2318 domain-containing protein [Propioniciclava sp.]|uniref:Fe-S-containing protein n=1 Tax=Propioniciclava sp. TaxID=2038686 RepID=UPI0039E5C263